MGMEELEPIETASLDELRALQIERLRATIQHTYANVAALPRGLGRGRRAPGRRPRARPTWRGCPFTTKADLRDNYPFGMFAVPREQVVARARVQRYDGPADGRRLHRRGHRHVGDGDGALHPRGRRPAGRPAAQRLRLRAVHRRPRRALRRREARLHRGPGLRRHDRAAGPADRRLRPADHHGDAVVHARDRRRDAPPGPRPAGSRRCRSGSSAPSRGPTRCAARWRSVLGITRSTSTGCPR